MAINNMFSTWFNSSFSGWNNNKIEKPTKKDMFPWLTDAQINKIEELTKDLTWAEKRQMQQTLYEKVIEKVHNENAKDSRTATENELWYKCLNEKNPQRKNYMSSCNRQEQVADKIKEKYNLDPLADTGEVIKGMMAEMQDKWVDIDLYNKYLESWDKEFLYKMWYEKKPSNKWKKIATTVWVGAWIIAWADATLYGAWKLSEKIGEKIYEFPIDSSMQEAKKINQAWTKVMDAEEAVKDAKADLKVAKKTGEWVEEAEKALETAEKDLATAKWKKVVKVADTAREYNVWGWILEWWTAENRWIQASSKANQIFKKTIEPALEKSTAKINVQELINWLEEDIQQLAKNDPDKLAAYWDALEDLKASYKDPKFANYSMKDTQTLKSWLQGRTPQKFYKGKEITNELQELKWILWSKLTNAVHTNLTKEIWEDSAKLYKDYANLKEYAGNMVKQSTNAWLKAWFWNFWSTTFHKLTDGASAKVWLLLNKWWKWVAKATWVEKAVNTVWDVWNYVVKNGKKFIKATKWGGLRVEDPVWMIQLLRLVPWSIGEAADAAAESPAVAVDDLLFEVQDFKDTWNSMSDEERIQNIKDQFKQTYGSELNDESAIETYERWKKKHPNGKYWLRDTVNDIDLVMRA